MLAGVLVQVALLAAISGMPPHHPAKATTAFRLLAVGAVGGFLAGVAANDTHARTGAIAGLVAGAGVGAGFWWLVLYGDTVGIFHHVHYALATTPALVEPGAAAPRLVAAAVGTAVAVTGGVGGFAGGYAASEWP